MKIGVISDIHSNSLALERVLEAFSERGIESILCAGDLIGYGSQPNRVVRLLRILDVTAVRGNHDDGLIGGTPSEFNIYAKRALDWNRRNLDDKYKRYLEELPDYWREEIDGQDTYMVHGSPKNPISGYIYSEDIGPEFLEFSFKSLPNIVIMGQTHLPYSKTVGRTLVVNPGSVGQPRDGDPRASCAIIDTEALDAEILRIDYDQQKVAEDILQHLPKKLANRVLSGE